MVVLHTFNSIALPPHDCMFRLTIRLLKVFIQRRTRVSTLKSHTSISHSLLAVTTNYCSKNTSLEDCWLLRTNAHYPYSCCVTSSITECSRYCLHKQVFRSNWNTYILTVILHFSPVFLVVQVVHSCSLLRLFCTSWLLLAL